MRERKAFTLIELLVVIAIIALLMSILAPALTRVMDQAKNALCLARLHQWAAIFSMYSEDNDGHLTGFHNLSPGDKTYTPPGETLDFHEHCWVQRLHRFYAEPLSWDQNGNITASEESWEFCMCPNTEKTWYSGEFAGPLTGWDFRWDQMNAVTPPGGFFSWYGACHGSYGKNSWVTESTLNTQDGTMWYDLDVYAWHTTRVRGVSRIPLFCDSTMRGGFPQVTNPIPSRPYYWVMELGGEMGRFAIDRHHLTVNMVFLDLTVRKVGLKQCWQLFWHRNWDLSLAPDPRDPEQWPSWLRNAPMIELGF